MLNITLAQPLAGEYAELFRGLGDDELIALADSFAFENCVVRETPARPAARRVVHIHPASMIHRCAVHERLSSAASQSTSRATSAG